MVKKLNFFKPETNSYESKKTLSFYNKNNEDSELNCKFLINLSLYFVFKKKKSIYKFSKKFISKI